MSDLTGKRAFITGGADGIGIACAQALVGAGVQVIISDIDQEALTTQNAKFLETDGPVETITLDVTDRGQVEAVFDKLASEGGIDILVTSTAIVKVVPILDFSVDDWDRILASNLTGVFHCCQCAGHQMVERGFGRIINISSVNGQIASTGRGAYSCSKGGVDSLTRLLAAELGKHNITVNAVAQHQLTPP